MEQVAKRRGARTRPRSDAPATPGRAVYGTLALLGVAPGFFVYGWTHMMRESVGLSFGAVVVGLLVGVVVPLGVVAIPLLIPNLWFSDVRWPTGRFAPALAAGLIAGCFLSEASMLVDEARFEREIARCGADKPYARARAWPWTDASLVYYPGRGTHATD